VKLERPVAENRPTPPDVDRVAASRAAVAARRALDVLSTAISRPDGVEGRLRVTEFLTSIPAIGVTKMRRIMSRLEISPSKRLGGLGKHQRDRLRDFLSNRSRTRRGESVARLVVLAGPTAVGKGTIAAHIRDHYPQVLLSVSATTRSLRPGETEGVSYYFVDDAEFDRMVASGELLEWAVVHNAYRYGTPRGPVEAALAQGHSVLLEIDIQGARSVRSAMPEARLVFLLPPSWDELVRRLIGRGTESPAEQTRRLETAKLELAAQEEFDFRVVNHDVAVAAREVVDLMNLRQAPQLP
jgi:guanylate kinase